MPHMSAFSRPASKCAPVKSSAMWAAPAAPPARICIIGPPQRPTGKPATVALPTPKLSQTEMAEFRRQQQDASNTLAAVLYAGNRGANRLMLSLK